MTKKQMKKLGEIMETEDLNGEFLQSKIYTIRGQKVMLDADLAKIYGYETKAFNRQVRNNMGRFEGEDFMFQLTVEEIEWLSRCNFCTSIIMGEQLMQTKGVKGGRVYLPYAFTEQGVYMLMTVLRGPLAVKQSRILIRLFKTMKDYIIENQEKIEYKSNLRLAMQVMDNLYDINKMKNELNKLDGEMDEVNKKLGEVVMRSEISPILLDFNKIAEQKEHIFLNGEPMRASEFYVDIYSRAKQNIYIIDNYISIKTLRHLKEIKLGVKVIVFSDNKRQYLSKSDYLDYKRECPEVTIEFIRTEGLVHDRFVIIDYGTETEAIYHCGASEKDAGGRIMAISKFEDGLVKEAMQGVVERLEKNRKLMLR